MEMKIHPPFYNVCAAAFPSCSFAKASITVMFYMLMIILANSLVFLFAKCTNEHTGYSLGLVYVARIIHELVRREHFVCLLCRLVIRNHDGM